MSDEKDYINEIRNLILKNKKPSYETTNRKEIHVRCPYCGDSKHDNSKARFYIEMKPPFRFHCFKCETSGVLNQQVLRDLGIFNNDLTLDISEANKVLKTIGVQKIQTKKVKNLKHESANSELATAAMQYFNKRYASKMTPEYIQRKFKAVLDAPEFFKENNLYVPSSQFNFSKAIGFISSDSSHIIFRDITGMQSKRYYNLCLVRDDEIDSYSKMYNISADIDVLQDEVTLVMTEGIFDIIGVYMHFYKDTPDEKNVIFAAACGKAYAAVIQHYIRLGFLNLNIIIYSDADVPRSFYEDMKKASPYLKNSTLTVYYNALYNKETKYGKDYGVPKNQIKLKMQKI